jgi:hypothetical protein
VDDTATMLMLKFLVQGRTSQPAHSFWLLKADGSKLTGGLAMQDRLKDQGIHSGSVLFIARDEEDTPLTVHDSVHEDVRPREHWGVSGTNIADAGKGAQKASLLENGRAAGDIETWCWNGATPDAMARPAHGYAFCCTATMLDFDTPIRLLRNSQSTTALRRQKS